MILSYAHDEILLDMFMIARDDYTSRVTVTLILSSQTHASTLTCAETSASVSYGAYGQ